MQKIDINAALQAHPEFLNEQIDDHDKAIYAKGWNACNSAFYGAIKELPTVSPDEARGVGKWVGKGVRAWSCSCCGTPLNHIRQFASFEKNELPNYCPSCGARMGGVQDALS